MFFVMSDMKILLETSARHVHVTKEDLETLFGKGHELTVKAWLSQPGQFASNEKISLVGPRNRIDGVSILGPARPASQVEISLTDARTLGVSAPVKQSGDIEGTPGIILEGPAGHVELSKGVIAAKRHIHLTPDDAKEMGIADGDVVSVKVDGDRGVIFGEVVVRVNPKFAAAMHVDVDESNAAGLVKGQMGTIIK